jgi:C-terminal processing protease CtpA/Prc
MARALALVLLLAGIAAAPAAAQEGASGGIERTLPRNAFIRVGPLHSRPSLGIVVDMRAGASDSIGARIESVTPGGPADRAGVRSGDIITRFGGKALIQGPDVGAWNTGMQSQPGLRLIEFSARLAPNDTVPLQLRRGRGVRNVRLVTEPLRTVTYWRQPVAGSNEQMAVELQQRYEMLKSVEPMVTQTHEPLPRTLYDMSPLASLQLAPLNPELGQYFGISDGILVISVPKSSGLRLRGGDVILRVDGRTPASPVHLLRILQSYDTAEQVRLDIVRNRKRETIEGTLAAR